MLRLIRGQKATLLFSNRRLFSDTPQQLRKRRLRVSIELLISDMECKRLAFETKSVSNELWPKLVTSLKRRLTNESPQTVLPDMKESEFDDALTAAEDHAIEIAAVASRVASKEEPESDDVAKISLMTKGEQIARRLLPLALAHADEPEFVSPALRASILSFVLECLCFFRNMISLSSNR